MARGDHIKAGRGIYSHHGIDLGDGRVIHYSGLADGLHGGPVAICSESDFARGRKIKVIHHRDASPPDVVIERALSRLNEDEYGVVRNNCEHFASWALTGRGRSRQVRKAGAALGLALVVLVAVVARPSAPSIGGVV